MSVKVANITSATVKARDARRDMVAWRNDEGLLRRLQATKARKHEEETLVVFRVFVSSWLHSGSLLQEQTAEGRDRQADRLVGAMRGDRLGAPDRARGGGAASGGRDRQGDRLSEAMRGDRLPAHAAAVADVAASVDRAVAVEELGVPPRLG